MSAASDNVGDTVSAPALPVLPVLPTATSASSATSADVNLTPAATTATTTTPLHTHPHALVQLWQQMDEQIQQEQKAEVQHWLTDMIELTQEWMKRELIPFLLTARRAGRWQVQLYDPCCVAAAAGTCPICPCRPDTSDTKSLVANGVAPHVAPPLRIPCVAAVLAALPLVVSKHWRFVADGPSHAQLRHVPRRNALVSCVWPHASSHEVRKYVVWAVSRDGCRVQVKGPDCLSSLSSSSSSHSPWLDFDYETGMAYLPGLPGPSGPPKVLNAASTFTAAGTLIAAANTLFQSATHQYDAQQMAAAVQKHMATLFDVNARVTCLLQYMGKVFLAKDSQGHPYLGCVCDIRIHARHVEQSRFKIHWIGFCDTDDEVIPFQSDRWLAVMPEDQTQYRTFYWNHLHTAKSVVRDHEILPIQQVSLTADQCRICLAAANDKITYIMTRDTVDDIDLWNGKWKGVLPLIFGMTQQGLKRLLHPAQYANC